MNRRALMLVITGVVAAIAATVVIYFLINSLQTPVVDNPIPEDTVEQRVVVVATTDIAANTGIQLSQVTTGTFPIDMIPEGAIARIQDVVSKTTTIPIFSGQIVLDRAFTEGPSGLTSGFVEPGKVLVAFPSTDMLNATGAVQKGDRVDIMVSLPISGTTRLDAAADSGTQIEAGERALVSGMTLQNVEVRSVGIWDATGQQAAGGGEGGLKIITFMVDPQEALILKYIKDSGGTIDLAVRSLRDPELKTTDPVTLDYLVDLFKLIGLSQPSQPVPSASGN